MKKLATLLLAAGLVFGAATGASAIDFKAKGQFIMSFGIADGQGGYSETGSKEVYGYGGSDNFEAQQRVRLQLQAIASESLSGTVYFEMGNTSWGNASQGGALGSDGKVVEVKHAYIDWIVPNTELKVRMGLQALGLPAFTTGTSQVFVDDVAGIVLSNRFNDNFTLTAFWARPYNDNSLGGYYMNSEDEVPANYLDNVDMFGLLLPMTFDGFKITPWVMYSAVGQNFTRNTGPLGIGVTYNGVVGGLLPATTNEALNQMAATQFTGAAVNDDVYAYGQVWNAGVTGEITMADPFRIAWDLNYGEANWGEDYLRRAGWYGSLLFEYKMDWGTPGLYGWYSTGDDADTGNGSERMAVSSVVGGTNGFSNFAFTGHPYISREGVIGNNMVGTWGIGLRLKDFSFLEDLKHTFRVNYIQGTNDPEMAQAIMRTNSYSINSAPGYDATVDGLYLTTADSAWEFGLSTNYQIYENLSLFVDASYMIMDMDQDTWDNNSFGWHNEDYTKTDAFNVNASFVYSF